jgi:hypothetical protein
LCEHDRDLALHLVLLQLGVAVRFDGDRSGTRQEVYAVVVRSSRWDSLRLLEDSSVVLEKSVEHGSLDVGGSDRRDRPRRA